MSLGTEQERFSYMLADLILKVDSMGYKVRLGDVFRDKRLHGDMGEKVGYGHKNSCHKLKLAADLNITKDGVYLQGDAAKEAHNEIHDYWDSVGGGKRIDWDLNHYSLGWKGML